MMRESHVPPSGPNVHQLKAELLKLQHKFEGFVNYVNLDLKPRLEAVEARLAELSEQPPKPSTTSENQGTD
jgi:hypothetical protein